jgi:hypothetical protein
MDPEGAEAKISNSENVRIAKQFWHVRCYCPQIFNSQMLTFDSLKKGQREADVKEPPAQNVTTLSPSSSVMPQYKNPF